VAGSSGGRRVLVVDDLGQVRELISRALSASGYEVDLAANLAEAREKDPRVYDAVLVDAHLGAERGIDLIEALQSEDPAAAKRFLVITGGATDMIPDGVARLTKPFQLDDLLAAVHALHQPDAAPESDLHAGITAESAVRPPESATTAVEQPAGAEPRAWQLLRLIRRPRARELNELVDFLHDGPIQDLTAVKLDLQMMARSAPDTFAPKFEAAQRQLDAAAASLRWLVDGSWPFVLPETGLADVIRQRTAWLLAAPATVDADVHAAGLAAIEMSVIADITELMLLGILPASPPMQVQVAVRAKEREIQIELTLAADSESDQPDSDQAAAKAALDELASALGATAQATLGDQHWGAHIALPRQPRPATA
jgi:DNA-binding response OmpR family regulator